MKKYILLLAVAAFLFPNKASAQRWLDKLLRDDSSSKKTAGFVPLPICYYSPDTRFGLGAMGVYYFKLKQAENDSFTRLSYAKLLADYTQNKQLDVWSSWNIFFPKERWVVKGELRYRNFPDRFYGIGNNTLAQYERYSYDLFTIKVLGLRGLAPRMFAGLDYQLTNYYNVTIVPNGKIATENISGVKGGFNSGFGGVFLIDRRDNIFYSANGMLLEFSSYFYDKVFGSNFTFRNYNLAYNKYITLHTKRLEVLAFQASVNVNTGNVPFYNLATAGNDDILRGYARNRYRDKNFMGAQAEWRFNIYKRLGAVLFTGVGEVFDAASHISMRTAKYVYGGGLRFKINRKENLNIRLDYGIGWGSRGFYLGIGEAF